MEGLEQLRTKAIGRSLSITSSSNSGNPTNEKANNILRQVNEKSRYLAQVIKSSLRNLPNSAVSLFFSFKLYILKLFVFSCGE